MEATETFRGARDLLLEHRLDLSAARAAFSWPRLETFNWALDWFDAIAAENEQTALRVVEQGGGERALSFAQLARRSNRVAQWMRSIGVARGDRVILMLGNQVELWEASLAAMKLGAVIIPATTLLQSSDLRDRLERGNARHVIANGEHAARFDKLEGDYTRIAVGESVLGWHAYADADEAPDDFEADRPTRGSDPLLLYFTSGTTARPKLVVHTHLTYPVGHLSTMYWIGLMPGDVHLNVASPGWAKHAWSNFFAPWNAEATVFVYNYSRFDSKAVLDELARCRVSTFCAPPTVWRMLIQEDLSRWTLSVRELLAAGEPLNPEVIERVRAAWGITVRDGYGQTETTAQIGNTPGARVKEGSMGRPLPGYEIVLVDSFGRRDAEEGEIALPLTPTRPLGLMSAYEDAPELSADATVDGLYHTGDIARRDAEGYITYVGRADDVFKASDYRISPFELESVLLRHPACAEAAVVPSPDPVRLAVPKAYLTLTSGSVPSRETALSILQFAREELAPYKRIRRLEFAELPKTISGKIRRVDLRKQEEQRSPLSPRRENEFWEEDFAHFKD
jgi:acetyl-CoA synthetase